MQKATNSARNVRCMASPEQPGTVNLEFRRPDGRVISVELDHDQAEALSKRMALQSKFAALIQKNHKERAENHG